MIELVTVAVRADGCFSVLKWQGMPFAVSLERTFDDDKPVIGNGQWLCKRDFYHKGNYETFEILVPGHDRVLFHKGNKEEDSLACVLVGESFIVLPNGRAGIGQSGDGFSELMRLTAGLSEFWMVVSGR